MATHTFCSACGMSWWRAVIQAMAIDSGAKTNDPNFCPETDDHEHRWNDYRDVEKDKGAG